MKKVVFFILLALLSMSVNAQSTYTKVTKYDNYNNVEWEKSVKTVITKTDSTLTVETEGSTPTFYYLDNQITASHSGRQDSLINLDTDVWGYESTYMIISEEKGEELKKDFVEYFKYEQDSLKMTEQKQREYERLTMKILGEMLSFPRITFRVISKSPNSFEYKTDMVWINFVDRSRIIYSK